MEYDPTRMCELLVGLGDVEVLSVGDEGGGPLGVHVRCRAARPPCGGCGAGTVTEAAREIAPPRALLTSRAARWATRQAGRGRPLKDAAAELGCGWHAVNLAVQRWGRALLDADTGRISEVAALGLDEHLMMRRGRFRAKTWGTSIVDVGRGQLLDIVRGRDAKAPTRWLLRRPREWREAIRWAVPGPLGPLPRRVQRRGAQSPTGR